MHKGENPRLVEWRRFTRLLCAAMITAKAQDSSSGAVIQKLIHCWPDAGDLFRFGGVSAVAYKHQE